MLSAGLFQLQFDSRLVDRVLSEALLHEPLCLVVGLGIRFYELGDARIGGHLLNVAALMISGATVCVPFLYRCLGGSRHLVRATSKSRASMYRRPWTQRLSAATVPPGPRWACSAFAVNLLNSCTYDGAPATDAPSGAGGGPGGRGGPGDPVSCSLCSGSPIMTF